MGTKHATGNADVPFEYKWDTISQVVDQAKALSKGMRKLNLLPDVEGEGRSWRFLGIQSKNRREWFLFHLANMWAGATTVALYDTLGQDAMKYVINQTELKTVCTTPDLVPGLCKLKNECNDGALDAFKAIIVFSMEAKADADLSKKCSDAGIELLTMKQILAEGAQPTEADLTQPKTDDVLMLSYTSGTTGNPKGVKLTHKMMIQCATSTCSRLGNMGGLGESDTYISYLPAAHSFE